MNILVRSLPWKKEKDGSLEPLLTREWLVSNGLGGYASGSISGVVTRRYHGLLISALPAPHGRMVMLNHLSEQILFPDGTKVQLGSEERAESVLEIPGAGHLAEFRLDQGLPVWKFEINGVTLEKTLLMPHMQNTVHVNYRITSGQGPVTLLVRPSMHFRPHEAAVSEELHKPYVLTVINDRFEVSAGTDLPSLRMLFYGERATLTSDKGSVRELFYRIEAERGYDSRGLLWSPGYFSTELDGTHDATLVASTESWQTILALQPKEAMDAEKERRRRLISAACPETEDHEISEFVLAADQFIITPAGRVEDAARARASGDEVRTVIAGYHWFTDWGRDTMISLEGLTLATGRHNEAGWILRTFAHYVKDGLIPNMFPEGEKQGLYHTADATLWFFHALDRYLNLTGDRETLRLILPKLKSIIDYHIRGTRFNIGVDPKDGLLRQGQEGYQLTWMDAKVEDWVVTPRRGKAVEINALWYNALCLMEGWLSEEEGDESAGQVREHSQRVRESFNKRFWYEPGGYLYDVVDGEKGDDSSCRPNQVFAISLPNPVLNRDKWEPVMQVVQERLLTPMGLRSLAPGNPDYKAKYFGDLRARDAAYHQGTVWAWLIGPFIDAWLKLNDNDTKGARRFLEGFNHHLNEACIGSISEIFDAEQPFTPRGCIAQAWSVAEVLRCLVKTRD
ncbi:MAG: glycogen debranching protein [Ignavibacteria bacterium]|nr:glycogen debranching protein [Ignavibacteria bacterium]MCU7525047.1 glycogen debranching protein [Ignavibacteria bacterium]